MPAKKEQNKTKVKQIPYHSKTFFRRRPLHRLRRPRNQTKKVIHSHTDDDPSAKRAPKRQQRNSVTNAPKEEEGRGKGKGRLQNSAELALRVSPPCSTRPTSFPSRGRATTARGRRGRHGRRSQRVSRRAWPSFAAAFVPVARVLLSGPKEGPRIVLLQRKETEIVQVRQNV